MGFLRSIIAKVGMDATGFESGAKRVEGVAKHMGEEVAAEFKGMLAGAFGAAAIEEGIRSVVEYAVHIKEMADQTGISTEEVQRLGYAAKATGLQFEDFQTALSKMGGARKEAAEKNDELLKSFERFGVSLADLQNPALRNIDLMHKISEAMRGMTLSAGDRDALREFFGRSGDKLAESIGKLDEFKDRPIISENDIVAIDRLEKAIGRLTTTSKVAAAGPVAAIGKQLTDILGPDESIFTRFINNLKFVINPVGPAAEAIAKYLQGPATVNNPRPGEQYANPIGPENQQPGQLFKNGRDNQLLKEEQEIRDKIDHTTLNTLTKEQRKVALQQEINQLLYDAKTDEELGDQKSANYFLNKAADKNNQLQELSRARGRNTATDQLNRIGVFVGGGAENIMADLARQNLAANKAVAANTARIVELLPPITPSAPDK